jgi:hypothetical protein
MSSLTRFGSLVLLGVVGLVGCAAPVDEGGGQSAAAQSGPSTDASEGRRIVTADYGEAQVVVHDGFVRGTFFSSMGDPGQGGATCRFTFAGRIDELDDGSEGSVVTATDGSATTIGRLRVTDAKGAGEAAPRLALELDEPPNACVRVNGTRPMDLWDAKPLNLPGVIGWAPVSADKSYFHDGPGTGKRAAFVVKGNVVTLKLLANGAVVDNGFVLAEYVNSAGKKTTGFLSYAELASPWATGE